MQWQALEFDFDASFWLFGLDYGIVCVVDNIIKLMLCYSMPNNETHMSE